MVSLLLSLALSGVLAISPTEATAEPGQPALRPTVEVVADDALTPWLVVRLLEDGYSLTTAPSAAQVQLTISSGVDGAWSVTAEGDTTVVFDIETAADPAVMRLEILHRSLGALEDVVPRARPEQQPTTATLVVTQRAPSSVAPSVAAEILAAGATLVPPDLPARLRVCADEVGGARAISVVDAATACEVPADGAAVVGDPSTATRTQLEVALGELEATEADAEVSVAQGEPDSAPVERADDPERAPGLSPEPKPVLRRTPLVGAPLVIRGGLGAGAIWRRDNVDAVLSASMTFGLEPGFAGWVEVQTRPATVVGDFRVLEVFPAFGFQLRPLKLRRFSLISGGLIGPEIHRFWSDIDGVAINGRHITASLEGMLGVAFEVWKQHEVQIGMRVGGSTARSHSLSGREFWRRGPVRVGAVAGFTFGRRLRR